MSAKVIVVLDFFRAIAAAQGAKRMMEAFDIPDKKNLTIVTKPAE
jgi:hypothetical protein